MDQPFGKAAEARVRGLAARHQRPPAGTYTAGRWHDWQRGNLVKLELCPRRCVSFTDRLRNRESIQIAVHLPVGANDCPWTKDIISTAWGWLTEARFLLNRLACTS